MQRTPAPGGSGSGGPGDDGDNRSRNAKAQRRHREKRKAHFKMLEESVQVLTQQLEEARLQLGAQAYAGRFAYAPETKDVSQLAAENAYLRDENADLRRQLYALRVNYARGDPPPIMPPLPPPPEMMGEVKQESYGVYAAAPGTSLVSPPRVGAPSSHGRTMSHPGDFVRDPTAEPGSATSQYPPPLYQFGPSQRASSSGSGRTRLMSSSSVSSAPSASPYVGSAPVPTDPRAHALSTPTTQYPVRYESAVYPAVPPPHNLPRSAIGSSSGPGGSMYAHGNAPTTYVAREGDVAWGADVSSAMVMPSALATSASTLYYGTGSGQASPIGVYP